MHALPSHPRSPFLLGLLFLAFALLAMAAAAPELGTLDFSLAGRGGGAVSDAAGGAAPSAPPQVIAPPDPAWTADPLAPPVDQLAGAR